MSAVQVQQPQQPMPFRFQQSVNQPVVQPNGQVPNGQHSFIQQTPTQPSFQQNSAPQSFQPAVNSAYTSSNMQNGHSQNPAQNGQPIQQGQPSPSMSNGQLSASSSSLNNQIQIETGSSSLAKMLEGLAVEKIIDPILSYVYKTKNVSIDRSELLINVFKINPSITPTQMAMQSIAGPPRSIVAQIPSSIAPSSMGNGMAPPASGGKCIYIINGQNSAKKGSQCDKDAVFHGYCKTHLKLVGVKTELANRGITIPDEFQAKKKGSGTTSNIQVPSNFTFTPQSQFSQQPAPTQPFFTRPAQPPFFTPNQQAQPVQPAPAQPQFYPNQQVQPIQPASVPFRPQFQPAIPNQQAQPAPAQPTQPQFYQPAPVQQPSNSVQQAQSNDVQTPKSQQGEELSVIPIPGYPDYHYEENMLFILRGGAEPIIGIFKDGRMSSNIPDDRRRMYEAYGLSVKPDPSIDSLQPTEVQNSADPFSPNQ